MDKLRVENYDSKEVVAKKQHVLKRATTSSCAVLLMLTMFSLAGCENENDRDRFNDNGGAGAWYSSVLEEEI